MIDENDDHLWKEESRAEIDRLRAENEMLRATIANSTAFGDAVKLVCDERMTEQKHEIRKLHQLLREEQVTMRGKLAVADAEIERLRAELARMWGTSATEEGARSMRERVDAALEPWLSPETAARKAVRALPLTEDKP